MIFVKRFAYILHKIAQINQYYRLSLKIIKYLLKENNKIYKLNFFKILEFKRKMIEGYSPLNQV